MAKSITTTYYPNATARCQNCNTTYQLGSTQESILVEICGHCHPFYTGQEVVLDTAGRIEKFQKRLEQVQESGKKKKTRTRKAKQSLADLSTDDSDSASPRAKKKNEPKDEAQTEEAPKLIDNNSQNLDTADNSVDKADKQEQHGEESKPEGSASSEASES